MALMLAAHIGVRRNTICSDSHAAEASIAALQDGAVVDDEKPCGTAVFMQQQHVKFRTQFPYSHGMIHPTQHVCVLASSAESGSEGLCRPTMLGFRSLSSDPVELNFLVAAADNSMLTAGTYLPCTDGSQELRNILNKRCCKVMTHECVV